MTEPTWFTAYIGIGSNLETPADQVKNAIRLLDHLADTQLLAVSGLYRSAPIGGLDQPDYINAVAAVTTQNNAHDLLQQLQSLETLQGRVRTGKRWESRVLDLDLLAFADQQISDNELTIPHPGIAERNFVLLPWNEIAPDYQVPGLATVGNLAARFAEVGTAIERLE